MQMCIFMHSLLRSVVTVGMLVLHACGWQQCFCQEAADAPFQHVESKSQKAIALGEDIRLEEVTLRPFLEGSRWGYMDKSGATRIPPSFRHASDFHEGLAAVGTGSKEGYIGIDGKWRVTLPMDSLPTGSFSEGRAWFSQNGRFGCVDPSGKIVVQPIYESVKDYSENLAVVSLGQLERPGTRVAKMESSYGYIDLEGKEFLPCEYQAGGSFHGGLAWVRRHGEHEFIDTKGRRAFGMESLELDKHHYVQEVDDLVDGLASVVVVARQGGKQYSVFINSDGKLAAHGSFFEYAQSFSERMAAVVVDHKFGFVNRKCELIIQPRFAEVGQFREGMCRVLGSSEWYFINQSGGVVLRRKSSERLEWNDAEDYFSGLARIHLGGRLIKPFDGGCWWSGGKWLYIDKAGTTVGTCKVDGKDLVYPPMGKEAGSNAMP